VPTPVFLTTTDSLQAGYQPIFGTVFFNKDWTV